MTFFATRPFGRAAECASSEGTCLLDDETSLLQAKQTIKLGSQRNGHMGAVVDLNMQSSATQENGYLRLRRQFHGQGYTIHDGYADAEECPAGVPGDTTMRQISGYSALNKEP